MLIAVCSVKGSPGVTTFCVALAACWPTSDPRVLVECDRSGGDVAARFSLDSSPGLVSLAAAARRSTDPGLVWAHTQPLPGTAAVVVTAPPGADQAGTALGALTPGGPEEAGVLRAAAATPGAVVIADCGRLDPGSPMLPIVARAQVTLLLSRAHADDLAHLASRLDTLGAGSPRRGLLLVGEGYSAEEVTPELGVHTLGRIPDDPAGAAALAGRSRPHRGRSRASLHLAVRLIARKLAHPALLAPPTPGPADQPVSALPAAGHPIAPLPCRTCTADPPTAGTPAAGTAAARQNGHR